MVEHHFGELPEPETTLRLFESAKSMFARLYPDAEAVDYSVELRLVRPGDYTVKS